MILSQIKIGQRVSMSNNYENKVSYGTVTHLEGWVVWIKLDTGSVCGENAWNLKSETKNARMAER